MDPEFSSRSPPAEPGPGAKLLVEQELRIMTWWLLFTVATIFLLSTSGQNNTLLLFEPPWVCRRLHRR